MDQVKIGKFIAACRKKENLTQLQLAEKLGITDRAISKWETGTTMPDIALLPMLSTEFGVTIDELFDLTAEQKLQRIERRIDLEEEFSDETFKEYSSFLKNLLNEHSDRRKVLSILAHLYHHRMESDEGRNQG